jgi:small multidrug resistance pump
VLVAAGYVVSFTLLIRILKSGVGIGLTYAIWASCGVALTAIGSRIFFGETFNAVMVLGVVLVIGGVVCIELGAAR